MNNYKLLIGVSEDNEEHFLGDLGSCTDVMCNFEDKLRVFIIMHFPK